MIKYRLQCEEVPDHTYDSWFGSSADYDRLKDLKLLTCEICGSTRIGKAIMAPSVKRSAANDQISSLEAAKTYEDVGDRAFEEACAVLRGEAPVRRLRGKASPAEVVQLLEAGVPVYPAPKLDS